MNNEYDRDSSTDELPKLDLSSYSYDREKYQVLDFPKPSNWKCYLFGNRPGGTGLIYIPQEGRVPNRFVRFFMRIFFDCLWVEEKK